MWPTWQARMAPVVAHPMFSSSTLGAVVVVGLNEEKGEPRYEYE